MGLCQSDVGFGSTARTQFKLTQLPTKYPSIDAVAWQDTVALWRADFNVPLVNGAVGDDSRLRAAVPGLLEVLSRGGGIVCLSHLGRPSEREKICAKTNPLSAEVDPLTTKPVAEKLSHLLQKPVHFCADFDAAKPAVRAGEVWMLENTRFNVGEKSNDAKLASRYAQLGDVFVMDAFATAHRQEASTCALAQAAAAACAGPLLIKELTALDTIMHNPARPLLALVGGGKVSSKLPLLSQLAKVCDRIILGGGIANTFLVAAGFCVGASLYESDMVQTASQLLNQHPTKWILPSDVCVATKIADDAKTRTLAVAQLHTQLHAIGDDEKIIDIGSESAAMHNKIISQAATVIWNGPAGVFEYAPAMAGTAAWAEAIAQTPAYTLAGGGDTLAAAAKFKMSDKVSYLSTGGGALLEALSGNELPALTALSKANHP